MPAPIQLDARVSAGSLRATISNLRQYGTGSIRDLQRITERSGKRAQSTAKRLAPKDSGYMASKLQLVLSAKRLAWRIGYDEADFIGRGMAFYPVFQELGFRHWITGEFIQNPHIRPAHRLEAARYAADVAAALRRRALAMRAR
jgi:hypothetical protein